ncbi:imidazole glycerol phosphate synthase subunit HisH [Luteolibacter sp. SL250]|uniref:imidazole glycerol phosphate synthase subunit HisH n=1 Tax=Luteolibacter sp. SL250 TaxID=2995170 RepID=UPI002270D137|nr:imidazole glycerol phosphate synthase subunit HisH [Luteolibacter sp. SL250]WAC20187.1 imidazole glycerol phosphate synthase subunit HisH [Luteolibacter sp. SL250]
MSSICIIDYGKGNLRSVFNAVESLGATAAIISRPADLVRFSHAILPGVGAFGEAMAALRKDGWTDALDQHAMAGKKPFLGICLGMQLIAEKGTEHGDHEGLGWIKGTVTRLEGSKEARVPHIGWNDVELSGNPMLYAGLQSGSDFYFVHSYALQPADESCVTGWCHHGGKFVASIEAGNIHATQFHPEKSQKAGLHILENFIRC